MPAVMQQVLAGSYASGVPDIEYTYLGAESSTSTSAPSYTFNYSDIDQPEDASRYIIGVFCFDSATNSPTVSGITVDGVAATLHINRMDPSGTREKGLCIFSCLKQTGSSTSIIVTFSQTAAVSYVMRAYAAINVESETPVDIIDSFDDEVTSIAGTIDVEDGGLIIAGAHGLSASNQSMPGGSGFTIDSALRSTSATGWAQLAGSHLATVDELGRALSTSPWRNSVGTGENVQIQFGAISLR
jgi:hypothetical protein